MGWEAEYVQRSGCGFWMGIDNYPALACKVIGRVYYDQNDTDRVVGMGAAGADVVFARAEPIIRDHPEVHAWVLLNEASIWSADVRAGFGAFNRRLTERLSAIGARHVCGNVNVGHPDKTYWDAGIRAIGEAAQGAAYLGLHGYSWPGLMDGWADYVGRFERIYTALRAAGFNPPPCLMTEIGLDRAITGAGHAGWRQVPLSPQQLADQIAAFEQRVAGNADLAGALWFLAGAGAPWGGYGFDVDRDTAMLIAGRIKDIAPPVDPPAPPEEPALALMPPGAPFAVNELRNELAWHPEKRWATRPLSAVKRVIVHHTATEVGDGQTVRDHLKAINRGHIETNGWPRIGYHVAIGEKGVYWPCNELTHVTYHAGNANADSIGVCLIGNMVNRDPTQAQLDALRWLVVAWGLPAVGHKEVSDTACPGLWWAGLKDWVNGEPDEPEPPEEPTGIAYRWYAGGYKGIGKDVVSEAEFRAEFGAFRVIPGGAYHVREMQAVTGPVTFRLRVLDADGAPVVGQRVVWWWPDAPDCPGAGYEEHGVIGETKADGYAEFAMDRGAYYFAPAGGPHAAWLFGAQSDKIEGIGMLGGTEHDHFDVTMTAGDAPIPPDPPEPPEPPAPGRPRYYRKDGAEMTALEAATMFGPQEIHRPGAEFYPLYELAELRWTDGTLLSPFVTDGNGNPVKGVEVFAMSSKSGAVRRALTGDDGRCEFDMSADDWRYNAGFESAAAICGLAALPSQIHNTSGCVNDRTLGPRVLNPVFAWTATPDNEEPPAPVYHSLEVGTVGQGTVEATPAAVYYPAGRVVTLKATAAAGWTFAGWSGDASGAANPLAVTMDRDKAITATFTAEQEPPGDLQALVEAALADIAEARACLDRAEAKLIEALGAL